VQWRCRDKFVPLPRDLGCDLPCTRPFWELVCEMHRPEDEPENSMGAVSLENEIDARLPRNEILKYVETVRILRSPRLVIILSFSCSDKLLWHVKLTWHKSDR
jgi:hypothetical protein